MNFLVHLYELFLDSAPWLLLGLVIAGILKVFIPMTWMNKQLGGHGIKTTVKAALIGAPLPLCSCGVIPAAIGLRRAGASKAATTSFLVSTPETGIDSISVSYVLLGPFMTIVRPIAAIFSAIVAGVLVGKDEDREEKREKDEEEKYLQTSNCCSSKKELISKPSCCEKNKNRDENLEKNIDKNKETLTKIRQGLKYSATNLIDDIALWLLVGLSFAALVQAYLPDSFLAQWGNGILAMLVMVLISIPMYICATASTPIAAGLLLAGVSPGVVLVFMLAGPATNIATLGVVGKELGKRALLSYLTGVIGVALLSGYLVDWSVMRFNISVVPQIGPEHPLLPSWLTLSSAAILALLMLISVFKSLLSFRKRIIN
ncbi:SO_0444 family Cu/Zn efflux transporter [Marinomonas colpomeniae]|uniref:SO_0444 family Cu/Zn efflux transporter n=1 Tax=Marinomonas colpomeniae TaxID=2774408 RepID=A0ABR8NV19_9GAMM|nr:SO_0444 family Cu/Zn efflux transporter [Marinomonas colpomeniae]MBD5769898.1 SO_0444 family Cu/Zn efflux transporter [Marinomonas colpomeniae]